MNSEDGFYIPNQSEFQPVIGYEDASKSPPLVVRQTHNLLDLYYKGVIVDQRPAQDYFKSHSLDYLRSAREGSSALYDASGLVKDIKLEAREAAHHAFVVFSFMRDRATSPFFPKGFSSRGILRAPDTHEKYLRRVTELEAVIAQVAVGMVHPGSVLESKAPLFRAFKFFEVGSELDIRLTESEEKQRKMQTEQLNDLFGGFSINLE